MSLPSPSHSGPKNGLVKENLTTTSARLPQDIKNELDRRQRDNQDIIADALRVYLLLDQDAVLGFLDELWEYAPSMEQATAVSQAQDAVMNMREVPQR